MSLAILPEEVLDGVMRCSSVEDLKNISQCSSFLRKAALRQLFYECLLKPTAASISRFNVVANSQELRQLPRIITVWSYPDIDVRLWDDQVVVEDMVEAHNFYPTLDQLYRFTNASAVVLQSTADVGGVDDDFVSRHPVQGFENSSHRSALLGRLFRAINAYNETLGTGLIKDLVLSNLQNMPQPALVKSRVFGDVLTGLEGLHVQSTYEYTFRGPYQDFDFEERYCFHSHLLNDWIQPIAFQLRRLSLYDMTYWGLLPGPFPSRDLQLPQLQELSLGYYVIGRDDQLDWIFRCTKLRELNFHSVQVLCHAELGAQHIQDWQLDVSGWDVIASPYDPDLIEHSGRKYFIYGTRWWHFFDSISAMPSLVTFNMQYNNCFDRAGYNIQRRHDLGLSLHSKRYVAFEQCVASNPWREANWRQAEIYVPGADGRRGSWQVIERFPHQEVDSCYPDINAGHKRLGAIGSLELHDAPTRFVDDDEGVIRWCGIKINPHFESLAEDRNGLKRLRAALEERRLRLAT